MSDGNHESSQPKSEGSPHSLPGTDKLPMGALFKAGLPQSGWQAPSIEDIQPLLPQYDITGFLGRGGMGAVYKGIQRSLGRPVAIKILPPSIRESDSLSADRFKRESQALASLSHPGIVTIYEAGSTAEEMHYFVMEYVDGNDLATHLFEQGKLPLEQAMQLIIQVCEALEYAHRKGVLHRDIKPSNILLDEQMQPKIADFGLAKLINHNDTQLTYSSLAMGTPDYIAPECISSSNPVRISIDQRSDIYSTGVLLYQLLTGALPRGRFEMPSVVLNLPDTALDEVLDKALQTDRDKRYQSALEFKNALQHLSPTSAPIVKEATVTARDHKRLAAVLVALIAALSTAAFYYQNSRSKAATGSEKPLTHTSTKPTIKGDDREAANTALSKHGGEVLIQTANARLLIRSGEKLPDDPFKIIELHIEPPQNQTVVWSQEDMQKLANLTNLERLTLSRTTIKDEIISVLSTLPSLTRLALRYNTNLTDISLENLSALHGLTYFKIEACPNITSNGLRELHALKELKELHLSTLYHVDDRILPAVQKLKNLEILFVQGSNFSKAFFEGLHDLPRLYSIGSTSYQLTPSVDFSKIPVLRDIKLFPANSSYINDATLDSLKSIPLLRSVLFSKLTLTEEQLQSLGKNPRLKILLIDNATLPPSGLAALKDSHITNVEAMFNDTLFDDAALQSLAGVPSLKVVQMAPISPVTEAGRAAFNRLRPDVKVTVRAK